MKKGILLLFIFLSLAACKTEKLLTDHKGIVLIVEGNAVFVAFEVISESEKTIATNWFNHKDGHSYKKGDAYPDPSKEKIP
ncbi:hypothetical protein [Rhodonellum sp.]|uniref:hypothetical protein n=1 Tax=Rhodonellum sp. TaxID=2231180 RepID=UPI002715B981|nr:hypothetical protein [Rhodonellum sp.]MDO9554549.1 hypothetical protein [Rhodonellum sp.]